jgi:proteic killer suppression protein
LDQLHRVRELRELMIPPGNRLERLRGDRQGQHSIRINDQFRVCFRWEAGDAYEVEIADDHSVARRGAKRGCGTAPAVAAAPDASRRDAS